jgi:hypothetical protein
MPEIIDLTSPSPRPPSAPTTTVGEETLPVLSNELNGKETSQRRKSRRRKAEKRQLASSAATSDSTATPPNGTATSASGMRAAVDEESAEEGEVREDRDAKQLETDLQRRAVEKARREKRARKKVRKGKSAPSEDAASASGGGGSDAPHAERRPPSPPPSEPSPDPTTLFFIDTERKPLTDISVPAISSVDDENGAPKILAPAKEATPILLLPAHVSVMAEAAAGRVIQIIEPPSPDEDEEGAIEYLDFDDRKVR